MRLLVTGASGYVGASILRRAPKTWKIAATYFAHRIECDGVAEFVCDVRDAQLVNQLFAGFRPEAVIHTAAVMTGAEMMTTNVDGARNVARAAARLGARLIHMSSDVIFDGEHAPYDESDSPNPITRYAMSKALAETIVNKVMPEAVIVRTSLVYGLNPMDTRTLQTLAGAMPFLFTDEFRCPIQADDLADALIELAEHKFMGILDVAGPQRVSRYDFGVKLANALGVAPKFQAALCASSPTPRPRDCTLDIALAQSILKTSLRGVDEIVKEWNKIQPAINN